MRKWIGIGLSFAFLASLFFFAGLHIERADVVSILVTTAPWAVVAAIVLLWLNFAFSTERYRLILRHMPVRVLGFGSLYRLTFLSFFLAHFIAIGPAADVIRVGYGRLKFGLPMVTVIKSVVYDRVLALAGLAILGLILLPIQIIRGVPEVLWLSQFAIWLVSLGGIFIVTWWSRATSKQHNPFIAGIAKSITGFILTVSDLGVVIRQLLLAVGYGTTYGLTIWVLAKGMGLNLGLLDMLQFSPLILMIQSVPIFYMGWGAREAVIIGTLGLTGILSNEQALAVSLATGAVFFLASTPGAVVWLHRRPKIPLQT